MNKRNLALAAAVSAALCAPATTASAGEMEWFGAVYAKFLDGDRRFESALYNNAETTPGEAGGDQGQGIEFELMFRNQVSKQVEISGRLKARFNKNFWTNFGGFGPEENDERSAQYVKMRGVRAVITPGYEWIDSATIGSNDFGMFDAMTQGKYRYIDRDNASGLLFQGSMFENRVRWDLARVSLPRLFAGPKFVTRGEDDALKLETMDAAWTGQLRWNVNTDLNATAIVTYVRDKEVAEDELLTVKPNEDIRDGTDVVTRYDNLVAGLKAEIGEQQEQRGQLRKMLEEERKKLSALSTQHAPVEQADPDEEAVIVSPSGKPTLPEYTDAFRKTCESLSPALAAKAILAVGRFAAHESAIWRQTKPIKRLPEHYRIRINLDYRLIVHWQPGKSLRILDVIPRQKLESWIKRHG